MITRVEPDLHAALKERAGAAGVSLNTFVVRILAEAVAKPLTEQDILRAWLRREGMLVEMSGIPDPVALDVLIERTRGIGPIVDEILRAERER